jgi:hypothetical protein
VSESDLDLAGELTAERGRLRIRQGEILLGGVFTQELLDLNDRCNELTAEIHAIADRAIAEYEENHGV